MFLTPPSPNKTKFFSNKYPNDTLSRPYARIINDPPPQHSAPTNYLPALQQTPANDGMTTHHRGLERNLPPPAANALPDPLRASTARQPDYEHAHNVLPPPRPSPHSQTYDRTDYRDRQDYRDRSEYRPSSSEAKSSYDYYARAEEFRYHQELERTKQEELRVRTEEAKLAQRKMEHEMIIEAMRYSTHPNLIPLIFVGLGAANSSGFESAQQYINTVQQVQTHFGNAMPPGLYSNVTSPDVRRDYRTTPAGPVQYGALGQQQVSSLSSQAGSSVPGTGVYPSPAYQTPQSAPQSGHLRQIPATQPAAFSGRGPPVAAKTPSSVLPRLTTNEAQVSAGAGTVQPSAAGHVIGNSDRASPSPSIHFHHWQPPVTQADAGKEPNKTSPKYNPSLSQSSESMQSPRKRKATGPLESAPRQIRAQRTSSPTISTTSTSSRRPGRRRESLESGPIEKHEESRATSAEPRAVPKEEPQKSKYMPSQPDSSQTSQPTAQPPSAELISKPDT